LTLGYEHGFEVLWQGHIEVIPKPAPDTFTILWRVGPVRAKTTQPQSSPRAAEPLPSERQFTLQLTADQQVDLSISGQDKYGNPVAITGDVVWVSSDESIVSVTSDSPEAATAVAVGPVGTAAVTVTNDVDRDGTGDFMGSIAIDVVAGDLAEIEVAAGVPVDKPA